MKTSPTAMTTAARTASTSSRPCRENRLTGGTIDRHKIPGGVLSELKDGGLARAVWKEAHAVNRSAVARKRHGQRCGQEGAVRQTLLHGLGRAVFRHHLKPGPAGLRIPDP